MEPRLLAPKPGEKESFIVSRNSQGMELRGSVLRMSRYLVVFEVYNPYSILQLSEVLGEFQIFINERLAYSGRAVVSNLVNTGIMLVCEAAIDEGWIDVDLFSPRQLTQRLSLEFGDFLEEWERFQRILPEFKLAVADMQLLLMDLRRWLGQLEFGIRSEPVADRHQLELDVVRRIEAKTVKLVMDWFDRFDRIADSVEAPALPAHRAYARRLLHPLILCAPFVYRTFHKPLGYAGDYEMVNMILRAPYEGASLFAKLINVCFLRNPPAEAHRNRIAWLSNLLHRETERRAGAGRRTRILNLGCGPAWELQSFLKDHPESEEADVVLLDFNEETLRHAESALAAIAAQHGRGVRLRVELRSVHQILKDSSSRKPFDPNGGFDVIYCAGLFDYISDRVCKRLMNQFYDWLAPGGVLVATNVNAAKPFRRSMEILLEWHLNYRDAPGLSALAPDASPQGTRQLHSDPTGVNLMLEVRKPVHE